MTKVPDRISWAVDVLGVKTDERILEVGCGTGVAVSLIAPLLTTGVITGIDRSAKAIAAAGERNRAHVEAGRARFVTTSLHEAVEILEPFDTLFVINVNDLWRKPGEALPAARRLLRPGGRLLVFLQPPTEGRAQEFARSMPGFLQEHGFDVIDVLVQPLHPVSAACVVARLGSQVGSHDR